MNEDDQQPDPLRPKGWRRVHSAMMTPLVLPWWTVYAAAALVPFVVVVGVCAGWGASQWGAVATGLSGFSTLAAVIVALRQTTLARRAAAQAATDAETARQEADARVEREIAAYSDRMEAQLRKSDELLEREIGANREQVEAQLRKSDELHDRRARAESLVAQRAELMIFWPVLDELHWAAISLPSSHVMTTADREKWLEQRAKLALAESRASVFIHDEQVRVAIRDVVNAFTQFDEHLRAVESGQLTFSDSGSATNARKMRMTAIRAARTALSAKASACLVENAPDDVMRRAAGWSTPTTVEDL